MTFRPLFACLFVCLATGLFAQTKTETRNLSGFEKIAVSGGFDQVTLIAGAEEKITLETEGVDPEKVVTEVRGNTLDIHMKRGNYRNHRIKLTITYRKLEEVASSGSSDFVAGTPIKGDSFTFISSGSGNFKGTLDVNKFTVTLSGSSDVVASGRADQQKFTISGSGDIKAGELKGQSAQVIVSGSGDVQLNVDGPVKTQVSGSGSVENTN
ncbi:MAG: DUF2807 domain-containing protein [Saprospiraceae bacterium]|nr:DUF2807 domain-containing protein [Saprospiraceae bacterium]